MKKRLLYLDFMRGLFIAVVIWMHGLSHMLLYDNSPFGYLGIEDIDKWILILFSPFILMSTWAPLFALVSGTAYTYVNFNSIKNLKEVLGNTADKDLKKEQKLLMKMLKKSVYTSIGLIIISAINTGIFHFSVTINGVTRHSLIGGSFESNSFYLGDWQMLFYEDAIALIAISNIIISCTLYFLWRNDGYLRIKRNFIILTILGIFSFAFSPIIHDSLGPLFYNALEEQNYFIIILLRFIVSEPQSTFPNVGFAFFGAVFGIALSLSTDIKKIRKYGYLIGLSFIIFGIIVFFGSPITFGKELIGTSVPIQLHLLNFGLIFILTTFLVDKIEYKSDEDRKKFAKRTTGLRRFSLISMTIYILESTTALINMKWFLILWNPNPLDNNQIIGIVLLFSCFQVLFWYFLIRIWEKFDFKFSFEYFLINFVGKLLGKRSSRLNAKEILYDLN